MEKISNNKFLVSIFFITIGFLIHYIIFIKSNIINLDIISNIILLMTFIANYLLIVFKSFKKVILNKKQLIFLMLINVIISLFISAKTLFLTDNILSISIISIMVFVLTNIYIAPYVYNLIYILDNINVVKSDLNSKRKKKSIKFSLIIFLIFFITWFLAGLAFFPGNITSDTVSQIGQALGLERIGNAHPALCTIIIKWLLSIWNNPFIILVAEILFFSIVLAYIYKYLYENNYNEKILIFSAIFFALICNNLSLMTMIWKDIPFTIIMLLLTFELYKITKMKDNYFKSNFNIIKLSISLVLTYFFRHNGVFPYIITLVYLITLIRKSHVKKRLFGTIIISLFLVWFIKNPVFNYYNVDKTDIMSSGSASFAAKGLGALVYYNGNLTSKEKDTISKLSKLNNLHKYYDPYSIDSYSFNNIGWNEGIKKVGVSEIYKLYIENLVKNPNIIIRDRLDSSNLLWSYDTPSDGFNYKYDLGIIYPDYISNFKGFKKNSDDRYVPKSNILMTLITFYQKVVNHIKLIDIIIWRPAVAISLLIILIYYAIIRKIKIVTITLPTVINIMFWALLLCHQSYRYLWFIFTDTYFILLLLLLDKKNINQK